jgi:hypothetical protein
MEEVGEALEPLEEPSLVEYARAYGLTRDYRATHPLEVLHPSDLLLGPLAKNSPDGDSIDSEHGLVQLKSLASSASFSVGVEHEKLSGRDAALLLSSVLQLARQEPGVDSDDTQALLDAGGIHSGSSRGRRNRQLSKSAKVELPLLKTDHGLDMLAYVVRSLPDLGSLGEQVAEEEDEGGRAEGEREGAVISSAGIYSELARPAALYASAQLFRSQTMEEKLGMSTEDLLYLQTVLKTLPQAEEAEQPQQQHNSAATGFVRIRVSMLILHRKWPPLVLQNAGANRSLFSLRFRLSRIERHGP